jgi:hypothetical protein
VRSVENFYVTGATLVPLFLLTVVPGLRGLGRNVRRRWVELAYWSLVWPAFFSLFVSLAALVGWVSQKGLAQLVVFAGILWMFIWTAFFIRAQLEGVELNGLASSPSTTRLAAADLPRHTARDRPALRAGDGPPRGSA